MQGAPREAPAVVTVEPLDPESGYFGVRSSDGAIKTFFRPQPDPEAYVRSQLGG